MYENLHILPSGAAYIVINNDLLDRLKLKDEHTSAIVPLPGKIRGIKDWAIFVQQKDQTYRIRLRSNGPAINGLAKNFSGGGHALASGAVAKDESEIKSAVKQLDQIAQEYKGAKNQ